MQRRFFLGLTGGPLLAAAIGAKLSAAAGTGEPVKPWKLATGCPVADPFMLRRGDYWYLVGTQHKKGVEDRKYLLFRSADLKKWEELGLVLVRPEYEGSHKANYWAPEFVELEGRFYFYYTSDSDGDPERRYVRVAVSERIEGPYLDSGAPLVQQPSIDGDPQLLTPQDGRLFYTGNEGNPHVGQLLVDRFVDPLHLANEPRLVFPDETVEWEEGPFVIRREGVFYLFSSRGNWRDGSYHVTVARSSSLDGPWERLRGADGEPYALLHTVEGQWGPGHNSVFVGPDGSWWVCYHAWDKDKTGRYPWIAPITWDSRGYPSVEQ